MSTPTAPKRALDRRAVAAALESASSLETVFAPVHGQTAFEETVDRLGTAIKLGLLPPGTRLPAKTRWTRTGGCVRPEARPARSGYARRRGAGRWNALAPLRLHAYIRITSSTSIQTAPGLSES